MRRVLVPLAAAAVLATGKAAAADAPPAPGGATSCSAFGMLGTDLRDIIDGTSAADRVAAFGDDDHVTTAGGDDCASGGAGDDLLLLGPGDDRAFGRSGDDVLEGGPGRDVLLPGAGGDVADGGEGADLVRDERGDGQADRLSGGPGDDVVHAGTSGGEVLEGGPGDDVLHAANGAADAVECGEGTDRAFADPADVLDGCELPVLGFRPALSATPARGGGATTFRLLWDRADGPVPHVVLAGWPRSRSDCATGGWRFTDTREGATVRWGGRRPPCRGRYGWAVVDLRADVRIDCETRGVRETAKGARPERACAHRELVGTAAFVVR